MIDQRYDVLIVGSGPAGSIAALVLARGGARVALVDKAAFPRDKACGDLIGPRGVQHASPQATTVDATTNTHEGPATDVWATSGFSDEASSGWRANGFDLKGATVWGAQGFTPRNALSWQRYGFGPDQAAQWRSAAFSQRLAKQWAEVGFSASEAREWLTAPGGATPAHVAARTLEAIRAGEFWIIPNGGERAIVEARFEEALAGFPSAG